MSLVVTEHDRPREGGKKIVSVVIPAFNEQEVLPECHRRVRAILDKLPYDSEIVYVNDGSTDSTLDVMNEIRRSDPGVSTVDLSRNFGKEIALTAGLEAAVGDAVAVMDADLQDPPELIPELLKVWEQGHDVVYGRRERRAGETALKKWTASIFYRLMRQVGPVKIPRDTGDFRVLSRRAVDALLQLPEHHRFMKGLFTWIGFSQIAVSYQRDARFAGQTKWNYWKLWNLALEGITSFTIAPLKGSTYFGLATAVAAFVYGLFLIGRVVLTGVDVPGYASLMVVVLFLGGTQLVALGVIGEYLGRMFNETKNRPLFFVKDYLPSAAADAARQSES